MPRAKTQFGQGPWARRWLDAIEQAGEEHYGRLQRARSYVRNDHVWRLSVTPGQLQAQVLGSYGYYTTAVGLPPLPDAVWRGVIETLATAPGLVATLLAGGAPEEIEGIVRAAGGTLFPADLSEFGWRCSCPDWEEPCKHALAVCYSFSMALETTPALLLLLRGQSVEQIVAATGALWASAGARGAGAAEPASAPDDPTAERTRLHREGFYAAHADLAALEPSFEPPTLPAELLRGLGQPPFALEGEDALAPLTDLYTAMTDEALRALSKTSLRRKRR